MAGRAEGDLIGRDQAAVRVHAPHPIAIEVETGDLAILDQVDTHLVRLARERPGDVVMLGNAPTSLQRGSDHGIPYVGRDVDDRAESLGLRGGEPFSIDPVQPVGVDAPHPLAPVTLAVHQVENAALTEQDVVIQLFGKMFPELQRVLVDRRALIPQVIRSNHRGVARDVAAREPAAFQHGNVGDAVIFREVVGRRQAVTARAHDDDLIRSFGLGVAPEMIGMRVRFGHPRPFPIYKGWSSRIQSGGGAGLGLATLLSTTSFWPNAPPSRSISSKPCSRSGHRGGSSIYRAARAGTRSSWPAAVTT